MTMTLANQQSRINLGKGRIEANFIYARGGEAMGTIWSYLDFTPASVRWCRHQEVKSSMAAAFALVGARVQTGPLNVALYSLTGRTNPGAGWAK
jgi:hypothetical protein